MTIRAGNSGELLIPEETFVGTPTSPVTEGRLSFTEEGAPSYIDEILLYFKFRIKFTDTFYGLDEERQEKFLDYLGEYSRKFFGEIAYKTDSKREEKECD